MRIELAGTAVTQGMALGRARLVQATRHAIDQRPLADHEVAAELQRLHRALDAAQRELQELRGRLDAKLAAEVNDFIEAHSSLLNDRELRRNLDELIDVGRYRADAALKKQRERLVAVFTAMDDPYLRSRSEDIEQVLNRVISILHQRQSQSTRSERRLAAQVGTILITDNIAPAELAQQAGHGLLGIISNTGSPYSHSAILARSLDLPMLVGVLNVLAHISDGELVLIDAERGQAILHPDSTDLNAYRNWQRRQERHRRRLTQLGEASSRSADGTEIQLLANVELPADIALAHQHGANGIGLYRSEFLFMRRKNLPTEEEQFIAYRDLVLAMSGRPVTIRTLDLGADKTDASGLLQQPREENPALGMRGVRLSLRYPAIFTIQIRAILRAACYGPLQVLVPMVTQNDELIAVRSLFKLAREELLREGLEIPQSLPLGAMIEVPAAAINIRSLLAEADFLAIGTNDLMQYLLAADRSNEELASLYTPLQPALLRLIAYVIKMAKRAGKPVSLCGEIGGDVYFTAMLLALGLTRFSMHPRQLLAVRARLTELDRGLLRRQLPRLLRAHNPEDVEQILAELYPSPQNA